MAINFSDVIQVVVIAVVASGVLSFGLCQTMPKADKV